MAIWLMLLLGGPVKAEHVEAELVARYTSVRPGRVAEVGVRLKLDPGWHVYWFNPGDSGDTVHLKWTLPEGVTASEIRWPVPHRIHMPGDLMNFGYEGELALPVHIEVPKNYSKGTLRLAVKVEWLACDENMCLPGIVDLDLDLPVADEGALPNEPLAAMFAEAEARFPRVAERRNAFLAYWRNGKIMLQIDMDLDDEFHVFEFFPSTPDQIKHVAEQPWQSFRGLHALKLTPKGEPNHLNGVLVIDFKSGYVVDLDKIHPDESFPVHWVAIGVLLLGGAVLILRRRKYRPVPDGGQPGRDHGASSNGT